jgi:hypothetical protein
MALSLLAQLARAVEAVQAVTQPLSQSALSVKSGEGAAAFPFKKYFKNPGGRGTDELLQQLDAQLLPGDLQAALGEGAEAVGLLGGLANPTARNVIALAFTLSNSGPAPGVAVEGDPRVAWVFPPA